MGYNSLQTNVNNVETDRFWGKESDWRRIVVVKTSSPCQIRLFVKDLLDQMIAPIAPAQMPAAFLKRELPENSIRFFFAKIMT